MVRQLLAVGGALLALLVFSVAPAMGDRLGGAYRGPYQDNISEKETPETDTADAGDSAAPDAGQSDGDSGGGDAPPPSDGTSDGSGGSSEGGGEGGGEGDGGAAAPPPSDGGATGGDGGSGSGDGGTEKPTGPGDGGTNPGASVGPNLTGPGGRQGGKTAVEDVFAYWPFWFEHNKEWVLHEHLAARAGGGNLSQGSSVWYFAGGDGAEKRIPITDQTRKDVVLPLLIEATNHGNPWIRDAAVIALGKLGLPEVVEPLALRVKKDKDVEVRQDALLALGLSRQKEALDPLLDSLNDKDLQCYGALGLALLGHEEALPTLLERYQAQQRARNKEFAACLAIAIGQLGNEKHVAQLAAPLKSSRGDNDLKVYVCHALAKIGGTDAEKWVLRALGSRDQGVQAAAVLALSRWNDTAVVKELTGRDGLKSGNRMATLFSLVSLGKIAKDLEVKDAKRKSIRVLVQEWAEKPQKDKYRSMYAALSLALMGDPVSNRFFMEMLEEENRRKYSAENHSAIAVASGLLGIQEVASDLREILTRKTFEADYRGYAAFALGIMGHAKSKDLVKGLLEEPRQKHEVLRSGAWALGLLGGPSDVDALLKLIEREGPNLHAARGAAALAIGLAGDASTVDKLLKVYTESGDIPSQAFALAALGCLVDSSDTPRIPQLFGNVHYRREFPVVRAVMSVL